VLFRSDIEKGEVFTEANVRAIRPGSGLPPVYLDMVLGRRAARRLDRGTALLLDHVLGEKDEHGNGCA
jgi:sialic acid synthase SpsE